MPELRRLVGVVACLVGYTCALVVAAEPVEPIPLHGEFSIGKNGRLVLLPIEVGGHQYSFLVDTGACRSGFDITLGDALGEPRGTQLLQTPAGRKRVDTFEWPEVRLREQLVQSDRSVACIDFKELRQGSNEDIYGVIGIDVLKTCRIQIDFDRGKIRFLDSLPENRHELGTRIPIEFSEDGSSYFTCKISDDLSERFVIDTGAQGNSLRNDLFDQLVEQKRIRIGGSYTSVTVAGEVQGLRGQLSQLAIGPFVHEGLRVSRVNLSSLGLRFFSRYQVTFDFPDHALYLKKGAQFAKSEPQATSGMALGWVHGRVEVRSVKNGGPASTAGIKPNDVLLEVNDVPIANFDHYSLRQLLTSEGGRKIPIRVQRAGQELSFEVSLEND